MSTVGFPRRFGSYVLLKPLARGGMGELDLAVTGDRGFEKLCVIKKVLPHLLAGENVQRFRDEAMVVVRLSHGNLVGVLDAGQEEGQPYVAMDFVEGKDLLATWNRCALKRIAFPVEIAVYIIKELVRGLGYAHGFRDLNLVHRDVSPANVLLSYSGEVKLTDFGLATSKLKEQHTAPGIIYGKLAYLAPEQARGDPLDGRTDLYSAGILLWEMLTGQQLFPVRVPSAEAPRGQDSTIDALERVRHPKILAPSKLTSRVPPELDEIVVRALAPNPGDRYQSGEGMRADLASFLAESAPETDAATLATFMSVLFEDQISRERDERDQLLARAFDSVAPSGAGTATAAATAAAGAALGSSATFFAPTPAPAVAALRSPASPGRGPAAASPPRVPEEPADELAARREPTTRAPQSAGSVALSPAERPPPPGPFSQSSGGQSPWWSQSPDQDPRVGTTIGGRYFLRRLCGEGAMGRVYEGHHIEIGRRVAVKILHTGYSHTPDVVERFRREARAASKIGHPNIVDVTDSGLTADGALFFVMDYLDGVNLEQLIAREGPLKPERALHITAQVCRALAAAHAVGIVHRDLKPANVMLGTQRDGEDFVKVLDFGISKQSDLGGGARNEAGLTRPDAAVGTPIYMAPEQVAGLPADARTDVYAVGELLYEMLTGAPPYEGSDVMVVFNKKANHEPVPVRNIRPEVPESVGVLIERAMARRPDARHPTMAALKDDVIACLARANTSAALVPRTPPGTAAQQVTATVAGRFRFGSRALWVTVLGLVAGLGCAAAFLLARVDLESPPAHPSGTMEGSPMFPVERSLPTVASSSMPARTTVPAPVTFPISQRATEAPQVASGDPPLVVVVDRLASRAGSADARATVATTPTAKDAAARPKRTPAAPAVAAAQPGVDGPPGNTSDETASTRAADRLDVGRAAFARADFPAAVRAARAALSLSESTDAHVLLGDAFFKLERFADAVREYDFALALTPSHPQARRGRELANRHLAPAGAALRPASAQSTP